MAAAVEVRAVLADAIPAGSPSPNESPFADRAPSLSATASMSWVPAVALPAVSTTPQGELPRRQSPFSPSAAPGPLPVSPENTATPVRATIPSAIPPSLFSPDAFVRLGESAQPPSHRGASAAPDANDASNGARVLPVRDLNTDLPGLRADLERALAFISAHDHYANTKLVTEFDPVPMLQDAIRLTAQYDVSWDPDRAVTEAMAAAAAAPTSPSQGKGSAPPPSSSLATTTAPAPMASSGRPGAVPSIGSSVAARAVSPSTVRATGAAGAASTKPSQPMSSAAATPRSPAGSGLQRSAPREPVGLVFTSSARPPTPPADAHSEVPEVTLFRSVTDIDDEVLKNLRQDTLLTPPGLQGSGGMLPHHLSERQDTLSAGGGAARQDISYSPVGLPQATSSYTAASPPGLKRIPSSVEPISTVPLSAFAPVEFAATVLSRHKAVLSSDLPCKCFNFAHVTAFAALLGDKDWQLIAREQAAAIIASQPSGIGSQPAKSSGRIRRMSMTRSSAPAKMSMRKARGLPPARRSMQTDNNTSSRLESSIMLQAESRGPTNESFGGASQTSPGGSFASPATATATVAGATSVAPPPALTSLSSMKRQSSATGASMRQRPRASSTLNSPTASAAHAQSFATPILPAGRDDSSYTQQQQHSASGPAAPQQQANARIFSAFHAVPAIRPKPLPTAAASPTAAGAAAAAATSPLSAASPGATSSAGRDLAGGGNAADSALAWASRLPSVAVFVPRAVCGLMNDVAHLQRSIQQQHGGGTTEDGTQTDEGSLTVAERSATRPMVDFSRQLSMSSETQDLRGLTPSLKPHTAAASGEGPMVPASPPSASFGSLPPSSFRGLAESSLKASPAVVAKRKCVTLLSWQVGAAMLLTENKDLQELTIGYLPWEPADFDLLADALPRWTQLRTLQLSEVRTDANCGGEALPKVARLMLPSGGETRPPPVVEAAPLLGALRLQLAKLQTPALLDSGLTTLALRNMRLTDDMLLPVLMNRPSSETGGVGSSPSPGLRRLRVLDLSCNSIGLGGLLAALANAICPVVESQRDADDGKGPAHPGMSLVELHLASNPIDDAAVWPFVAALRTGAAAHDRVAAQDLMLVDLRRNRLSADAADAVRSCRIPVVQEPWAPFAHRRCQRIVRERVEALHRSLQRRRGAKVAAWMVLAIGPWLGAYARDGPLRIAL